MLYESISKKLGGNEAKFFGIAEVRELNIILLRINDDLLRTSMIIAGQSRLVRTSAILSVVRKKYIYIYTLNLAHVKLFTRGSNVKHQKFSALRLPFDMKSNNDCYRCKTAQVP